MHYRGNVVGDYFADNVVEDKVVLESKDSRHYQHGRLGTTKQTTCKQLHMKWV